MAGKAKKHLQHATVLSMLILLWPLSGLAIESLGYDVLEKHEDVEIRAYEPHLLATVEVNADFENAGGQAFRDLFNYIGGNNSADQDIAMTAPVIQAPAASGWRVSFVMPDRFNLDSLPAPRNAQILLESQAPLVMAAYTYRGNWGRERYLEAEQQLRERIQQIGYQVCAAPLFARHNPPFWPSFLRKNEVLIAVCR